MEINFDERIDDIGFGNLKLIQKPSDFCYGVDAVILSDFTARLSKKKKAIADLGTGTGIVPIILSHKTDAEVLTGFEVQEDSYKRALRNIEINGLSERLEFVNSNVKDIPDEFYGKYDTVTMNPPYMEGGRGLVNPKDSKMIARHEILGSLEDFISAASKLLDNRGELFIVHRPSRLADIFVLGRKYHLEPKDMCMVNPREGEAPNIVLVHLIKGAGKQLKVLPSLNIYNINGGYSDDVLEIYER